MPICRLVTALLLLMSPGLSAHEIRPGLLDLLETSPGTYDVTFKIPIKNGRPLPVVPVYPNDCQQGEASQKLLGGNTLVTTCSLVCDAPLDGREVRLDGLEWLITDVLVRLEPIERSLQVQRATPDLPLASFAAAPARLDVAATYFVLGIEHILLGIDHLLFVLALVLLITGVSRLVWTITAFTVAHSITLIGTSLGWLYLPSAPVEAVIALSIVFLANEIASRQPGEERLSERLPWLVAGAFGLLHGFGFAGALAEIGLPEGEIPLALLCFNLGVEAGQLAFVALVLVVLHWTRHLHDWLRLEKLVSYGIGIAASFWLFQRML